jgi:hypothetical protein
MQGHRTMISITPNFMCGYRRARLVLVQPAIKQADHLPRFKHIGKYSYLPLDLALMPRIYAGGGQDSRPNESHGTADLCVSADRLPCLCPG